MNEFHGNNSDDLVDRVLSTMKVLMKNDGVNIKELAKRLGRKKSNVQKIFKKEKELTLKDVIDFSFALDWEVEFTFRELNGGENE